MSPFTFTCFATIALVASQFYLTEAQFGGGGFHSNAVSGGGFASHSSSGFDRGFGAGGGFGGGHLHRGQFGGGQFGGGHHFGGGGAHFGGGGHSSGFQTNTVVEGGFQSQQADIGFRANDENRVGFARYASPNDSPAYSAPAHAAPAYAAPAYLAPAHAAPAYSGPAPRPLPCPRNILISCTPTAQAIPCVQPAPPKY